MAMPAWAQDEPGGARADGEASEAPPEAEPYEEPSAYRNPAGSVVIGASFGITVGGDRTVVGVGASAGYAVFTGVLPALRGLIIFDEQIGGELALNLTLTPPLDFYLVPFVVGEVGRRFDGLGSAWIVAGGGGLFIGEPRSTVGLQAGWVFRRYFYDSVELDGSGLLIALSIRF